MFHFVWGFLFIQFGFGAHLSFAADTANAHGAEPQAPVEYPRASLNLALSLKELQNNSQASTYLLDRLSGSDFFALGLPEKEGTTLLGTPTACADPNKLNLKPEFDKNFNKQIETWEQIKRDFLAASDPAVRSKKEAEFFDQYRTLYPKKYLCSDVVSYGCMLRPLNLSALSSDEIKNLSENIKLPGDKKAELKSLKGEPAFDFLHVLANPNDSQKDAVETYKTKPFYLTSLAKLDKTESCCSSSSFVRFSALDGKFVNACYENVCENLRKLKKAGLKVHFWTPYYQRTGGVSSADPKENSLVSLKKCGLVFAPLSSQTELEIKSPQDTNVVMVFDSARINSNQASGFNQFLKKLSLETFHASTIPVGKKESSNRLYLALFSKLGIAKDFLKEGSEGMLDWLKDQSKGLLAGTEMRLASDAPAGPPKFDSFLKRLGLFNMENGQYSFSFKQEAELAEKTNFLESLKSLNAKAEKVSLKSPKTLWLLTLSDLDFGQSFQDGLKDKDKEKELEKAQKYRQDLCAELQKLANRKQSQVRVIQYSSAADLKSMSLSAQDRYPSFVKKDNKFYFSDLSYCMSEAQPNLKIISGLSWLENENEHLLLRDFVFN